MSTQNSVRVRFAPSPTGGLHLGSVRTILFNYLFAKKHNGTFVLRIEDTDQSRFVAGAEQYIYDSLQWCGLLPDESPVLGGPFTPYRQSERKPIYKEYAEKLIAQGQAYYAFDTPEELEKMRNDFKTAENPSPQYDKSTRMHMRNSLSLGMEQAQKLIAEGVPYVVRINVPQDEVVEFTDMIRGEIQYQTNVVDDKVLLKADGMPTYHLAVVVDDYLMEITHAFRGEEWLPSAPVHVLLWKNLFGLDKMPQWAHLPLILKPDGHGKLSKRDGDRLGFPVFALNWDDPKTGELSIGFKEKGFLPQAFVNFLALLGWNSGTEQEIFSLEELCTLFDMAKVHKGGAKFDYEKAKWFNAQHIQLMQNEDLVDYVLPFFEAENIEVTKENLLPVIALVKDRCALLADFVQHGNYFFVRPVEIDTATIKGKWSEEKASFFEAYITGLKSNESFASEHLHTQFEQVVADSGLKKGDVMLPLRIMLVGGKHGPGVFDIMHLLGKDETVARIESALKAI